MLLRNDLAINATLATTGSLAHLKQHTAKNSSSIVQLATAKNIINGSEGRPQVVVAIAWFVGFIVIIVITRAALQPSYWCYHSIRTLLPLLLLLPSQLHLRTTFIERWRSVRHDCGNNGNSNEGPQHAVDAPIKASSA